MKKVLNVLSWVVVIFLVAAAMIMLSLKMFGYTPYAVVSGSMEPTYGVGSLVFVKTIAAKDVQKGDAITFVMDEELTVATHRVIDISSDGKYFYTKGDANKTADPEPVYYKNLVGKVMFSVPLAGYFSIALTEPLGKLILVLLACGLIAFALVYKLYRYHTEKRHSVAKAGI
ncbi:MAG: signal peptidase I [Acutalibacteraceae bacterium]